MMTKLLVVTDSKNAPLVVPEGVIKLLWYVSNPLPALPTSLKILIAPYVSVVGNVPDGLVFLEVTGNTLVNHAKIPNTCHIEVTDYGCLQMKESGSEIGKVSVENCVPHNASDLISLLRAATNKPSYVYKKVGENWIQQYKGKNPTMTDTDYGFSVGINGTEDIIVVEAPPNRKTFLGLKNSIMAKIRSKLRFVWDVLTYPNLRDILGYSRSTKNKG